VRCTGQFSKQIWEGQEAKQAGRNRKKKKMNTDAEENGIREEEKR
jgi:hypothetical protein